MKGGVVESLDKYYVVVAGNPVLCVSHVTMVWCIFRLWMRENAPRYGG
jgi:hypothetical protein